jgi:hypothetical protein
MYLLLHRHRHLFVFRGFMHLADFKTLVVHLADFLRVGFVDTDVFHFLNSSVINNSKIIILRPTSGRGFLRLLAWLEWAIPS